MHHIPPPSMLEAFLSLSFLINIPLVKFQPALVLDSVLSTLLHLLT
jgi:hypothetical protein